MTTRLIGPGCAAAMLLSGCTFQGALDAMVAPAQQAEIIRTAQLLCRNPAALEPRFAPGTWAESAPQLPGLASQCPQDSNVVWQLASYHFNSASATGAPTDRREFALVVAGDANGPWSEIQINSQQLGDGPQRIIGWNVARTVTRPASLAFIDSYDRIRWWGLGGTAFAVFALTAALLWVRKRRKAVGKGWTDA